MIEQDRINPDELIYSYTAEQAVADGVLLEVDRDLSKEAGYRWPVRITQGVASLVHSPRNRKSALGRALKGACGTCCSWRASRY